MQIIIMTDKANLKTFEAETIESAFQTVASSTMERIDLLRVVRRSLEDSEFDRSFRVYLIDTLKELDKHQLEQSLAKSQRFQEIDEQTMEKALARQGQNTNLIAQLIQQYEPYAKDPKIDFFTRKKMQKTHLCMNMYYYLAKHDQIIERTMGKRTDSDYKKFLARKELKEKLKQALTEATRLVTAAGGYNYIQCPVQKLFIKVEAEVRSLKIRMTSAIHENDKVLKSLEVLQESGYFADYALRGKVHNEEPLYRKLDQWKQSIEKSKQKSQEQRKDIERKEQILKQELEKKIKSLRLADELSKKEGEEKKEREKKRRFDYRSA